MAQGEGKEEGGELPMSQMMQILSIGIEISSSNSEKQFLKKVCAKITKFSKRLYLESEKWANYIFFAFDNKVVYTNIFWHIFVLLAIKWKGIQSVTE